MFILTAVGSLQLPTITRAVRKPANLWLVYNFELILIASASSLNKTNIYINNSTINTQSECRDK